MSRSTRLASVVPAAAACAAMAGTPPNRAADLPAAWVKAWRAPAAADRPLQIVHGIDPKGRGPAGMAQMVPGAGGDAIAEAGMRHYRDLGLGGVVCNVMFQDYLRSEPAWNALVSAVRACKRLGLVAWIYDEAGYPSGAAGGLVLKEHPEYEAQELAYDPTRPGPFVLRPAYEFTHASNNHYAARRYVNLMDDRATRAFIAETHEAYLKRLGGDLRGLVSAFFTDEPSLIAVNLGQIPESARKNVPVVDPIDPKAKALPAVPWTYDLLERYRERYGDDLTPKRLSLFTGDSPGDRRTRARFWALVADLVADRYFGEIRRWCDRAGIPSSGHNLWEEALMHHPALYGNGLKAISRMHIPGLDELSSDPSAVVQGHWMTAALPASAAMLTGGRRVFTEVSDFSQKMGGQGPASLANMQATAAWQAAFGVTEFTLYYNARDRTPEDYRAYCATVGRLNAILKPAQLDPEVLVYYPIHDLWHEYLPVAEPLGLGSQSKRAQRIVGSFQRIGQSLTTSQMSFCLVDHEFLARMSVRGGRLALPRGPRFRALVIPAAVELPPAAARVVARFAAAGGTVVRDDGAAPLTGAGLAARIAPAYRLDPGSGSVVLGRFVRGGRPVLVLVNVGKAGYDGILRAARDGEWTVLDPATAAIQPPQVAAEGVRLRLGPLQTVVLVGSR